MKEMKQHTKQMPGKMPSASPSAGTNGTSKSHEASIKLGEGLPIGSVHSAHTKEQVHIAKHNDSIQKLAHTNRDRRIAGNADPTGMTPVARSQKTGHGPLQSSLANNTVQKKAHAYNERSIAGNADPCAGMDCE